MNTSAAQLRFLDLEFSEQIDAKGQKRIFAKNTTTKVEIYPNQSVSIFAEALTRDVWDVIGLYLGDDDQVVDSLLTRAAVFCRDNPNTLFRDTLLDSVCFEMRKILSGGTSTFYLRIFEE